MSPTSLVERLARIDPAAPPFDRMTVERSLALHFGRLGLPARPVRWMPDLAAAFAAVQGRSWDPEWCLAEALAWRSARHALQERDDPRWQLGHTPLEPAARAAVGKAAWRREDARAFDAGRPLGIQAAGRGVPPVIMLGPPNEGRVRNPLESSWAPGGRCFALARLRNDGPAEMRATRFEPWRPYRFEHFTGAAAAEEAAVWLAAQAEDRGGPDVARMAEIWSALLQAFEGGLWFFFFLPEETVAVARPAVRLRGDRLHAEDGPALAWPEGTRRWFWRGVEVPSYVIEEPSRITPQGIVGETNVELRRALLERYGPDRFLRDLGAEPVHSDDFGTLYRVDLPGDEPLVMVKVLNSTPEPDGSRKAYFLRVPPEMQTAHEAVAWTFGLTAPEYRPGAET